MKTFRSLGPDRDGITAIEYAMIAAAVALILVVSNGVIGNTVANMLNGASNGFH